MTHNQISYWTLQEQRRNNMQVNAETNRHNLATEAESGRHNQATELIDLSKLEETRRSNRANESIAQERNLIAWDSNAIARANLSETVRHNRASEAYSFASLAESVRHNKEQESIGNSNITLGYTQTHESTRHNKAQEDESQRHNEAQETETNRHNINSEITDRYGAVAQGVTGILTLGVKMFGK